MLELVFGRLPDTLPLIIDLLDEMTHECTTIDWRDITKEKKGHGQFGSRAKWSNLTNQALIWVFLIEGT